MIDYACSLAMTALALLVAAAYTHRVSRRGAASHPRIDRAGSSPFLGKGLMQMGYWAMAPLASACIALGITANAVSWFSLASGAAAAFELARGHMGVGAALALISSVCDALDGMIARETGTASDSGEVLDATVDRYVELLFFAGLAYGVRADGALLGLVLASTAAAVMVSYASAKAEAFQVVAPRGAMRRQERAVYLVLGAALTPVASVARVHWGLPLFTDRAPLVIALSLVAIVGNASAIRRLHWVARAVRELSGARSVATARELGDTRRFSSDDAHATAGDLVR